MKTELLGCLEQKIMDILWMSDQPLKPADVQESLGNDHAYTTIMTVLKRMNDKGFVKRKLQGKVYFYTPVLTKDQFIKTSLTGIYNNLVGSYGRLAISQFVDTLKTNSDDLRLLQDYLKNNQ